MYRTKLYVFVRYIEQMCLGKIGLHVVKSTRIEPYFIVNMTSSGDGVIVGLQSLDIKLYYVYYSFIY